jgi:hypothetical protein|tara:strand:- start:191 stop:2176 length:1986 start_codon:yes stop_codon:yes gene_type:complete
MAIPNYYSYKKIYTSGDMFTLTGSDFYGFAETADGIAKEPSTGKTLVPKSTYKTDLFYTEYFKDRVVSDIDLTLPNTKDECLFNLNDNFNYDLFKYKLEKVRDNNSFVYSKLFIPSNKLPFASTLRYATVPTVNAQEFTINISDNNNPAFISNKKFSQNYYLSAFGNIVAATAQTNSHSTSNAFALFAATTTNLICLTGDDNKLTIIEDSTGYESNENDLAFNEIGGLASTKDFLYLSDTGNNVVLKYDIAGYSNNDSSLRNRRNYIELVGGFGGETRQTKFLRPTKLAATSTELAVFDSGNKVIKLFDSDLNFITRITSINFNTETFGAMGFDPDFGSLYVVTFRDVTTNDITVRTTYLYRFSGKGYRFKEEFILDDTLSIKDKEEVNSLSFSGTDSNYWYFGTNKTIYKKFKTRPVEVIGKFRTQRLYLLNYADTTQEVVNTEEIVTINNRWNFNDINFSNANFNWNIGTAVAGEGLQETAEIDGLLDDNITSFSIFPGTSSFDRAIMLTTGRLFFFDEPTASAYQRVLKDSNYNNYGSAGFSLNTDSFIQQSIVNTELYKVLNDILNIKNNIIGRFTGKFKNDILELDDYNYEVDFNQILTQGIENLYVHGNEENLTGVLNRCFSLIYELQTKLINIVQVNVEANVQPSFTLVDSIKI